MAVAQKKPSAAPLKDLYAIGEVPPLGHVPATMQGDGEAMDAQSIIIWLIVGADCRLACRHGRHEAATIG